MFRFPDVPMFRCSNPLSANLALSEKSNETSTPSCAYNIRSVPMQLRIENLSKTYANGVKALDDVSLTIPAGMYGLLGSNGAGKSSLMRTLATLQDPDSGSIWLGDINVLTQKDLLRPLPGYLPKEFRVYPRISAEDMLSHIALLKGFTQAG